MDKLENEIKINPDNQASFENSAEVPETSFQSAPAPVEEAVIQEVPPPTPAPVEQLLTPPAPPQEIVSQADSPEFHKAVKEEIIDDSKKLDQPGVAKNLLDILNQ